MISLSRPLVFFDLETTGINVYSDRIIQIAAIRFLPNGTREEYEWLMNPGVPIPKEATEVHGITNEMVKDKPRFGDSVSEISAIFRDADLGGYNIKQYDIPLLAQEFSRIGLPWDTEQIKIVDSYVIWRTKEPRNLGEAYKKYCKSDLIETHNAVADTNAALAVFEAQQGVYADLPLDVAAIHDLCFPPDPNTYDAEGKLRFADGLLTINFGKNKGRPLQELALDDPGYLEWILNGSFSPKVKEAVKKSLGRS